MKKSIAIIEAGLESAPYKTPEYKAFVKVFRSEFNKLMKRLGCTNLKYNVMHFEVSVFFTAPDGQMWYFNTGDVRFQQTWCYFRTVDSYTNYTGGANCNTYLRCLEEELSRYIH